MVRRKEQKPVAPTHRRSRSAPQSGPSSAKALGVSLGFLLFVGSATLLYYVTYFRSGNDDLRAISDAAQDRSRDQARRLVERLGQTNRSPSTEPEQHDPGPAQAATTAPADGLLIRLWRRWFTTTPPAPATQNSTPDERSGSQLRERMRVSR